MLLVGCVLWLAGVPVSSLAGWWLGFLVLTIAAERLELSRVMRHTRFAQYLFAGAVILLVAGAALGMDDEVGRQVMGAGYIGVAAWLTQHDVARRTVRIAGQARYMAMAMLAGYCWLPVTGLTLLFGVPGPFAYDISLHAVAIGFVLSMVFGHALIIFPAITGISLRYWWPLYLPLGLLHFSVVLRVVGDMTEIQALRVTSGPLTALSLIVFGIILVIARRRRQLR